MARVAWRDLSYWKKIGSNIKSVRRWRGLTDIQVAESSGIELKRYRKMERGETESVTLEQVFNLKKLFRVEIEEIIPLL